MNNLACLGFPMESKLSSYLPFCATDPRVMDIHVFASGLAYHLQETANRLKAAS